MAPGLSTLKLPHKCQHGQSGGGGGIDRECALWPAASGAQRSTVMGGGCGTCGLRCGSGCPGYGMARPQTLRGQRSGRQGIGLALASGEHPGSAAASRCSLSPDTLFQLTVASGYAHAARDAAIRWLAWLQTTYGNCVLTDMAGS